MRVLLPESFLIRLNEPQWRGRSAPQACGKRDLSIPQAASRRGNVCRTGTDIGAMANPLWGKANRPVWVRQGTYHHLNTRQSGRKEYESPTGNAGLSISAADTRFRWTCK